MTVHWRPIESAPKDGRYIILAEAGSSYIKVGFWNGSAWDDGDYQSNMDGFTHWMPMLKTPKGDVVGA